MKAFQAALDRTIEQIIADLSPEDSRNLQADPEGFSKVVDFLIERATPSLFATLQSHAPEVLVGQQREQAEFRQGLFSVWGRMLDAYDVVVGIACELGEAVFEAQHEDRPSLRIQMLGALHARACRTAKEISVLLRGGFADGAHARWRSVHEISVIAQILGANGDDLAERYANHSVIERCKTMLEYQTHCERLGHPPYAPEEIEGAIKARDDLKARYGKSFLSNYGWAATLVGNDQPTFKQLEEKASMEHWRPYYRMASHNVHATPEAIFRPLGVFADSNVVLAGPSALGLADPADGAAISLYQVTVVLCCGYKLDLGRLVGLKILGLLREQLAEEALKANAIAIERLRAQLATRVDGGT